MTHIIVSVRLHHILMLNVNQDSLLCSILQSFHFYHFQCYYCNHYCCYDYYFYYLYSITIIMLKIILVQLVTSGIFPKSIGHNFSFIIFKVPSNDVFYNSPLLLLTSNFPSQFFFNIICKVPLTIEKTITYGKVPEICVCVLAHCNCPTFFFFFIS